MRPYAIGLDVGITSVGWAALALDANENPCGIIDFGSRIFDAAEQPKTGASLAAPRREARSTRRRLRRHRHRKERIKNLIVSSGLLSEVELSALYDGKIEDIYALRVKALDQQLSRAEFARVLLHLAQRRGFKSNRKNAASKEDGKLLAAVKDNARRMEEHGYRTVGEMYFRDETFKENKRNKGGKYIATVSRDEIAAEVRAIFAAQRELGVKEANEAFESRYLEILLSQRSFDEGPGGNSPYGGNQIERMVGNCQFFPEEPRAAKATFSFEYFSLLEKVNHIRLISDGTIQKLTNEQRNIIIEDAFKTKEVSYAKIRKDLHLQDDQRFNIRYEKEKVEETEKKEKLSCMKAYHQMRTAIDKLAEGRFAKMPIAQKNAIGTALSLYKTSAKVRAYLENAGLEEMDIQAVESLDGFSKFGHISVKACDLLIPFLEQGMNYNEACDAAGLQFKGHVGGERSYLLHPTEEDYENLTSPVVRRAIAQTIKVINAIIRKEGRSPTFINIELAREMAKDFKERNDIKKENDENRAKNEKLLERIRNEYGKLNPTGQDIIKLRLYEEQGGVCVYSQKPMSMEKLFDVGYAEVDHIVPYSISFDDSRKNKVLVFAKENRDKGNRLPLQYLQGQRRDQFLVWVKNNVKDSKKLNLLLKEEITSEEAASFKERNLQDTKTASRFLLNYLADNLLFAESSRGRKKKVTAVNGAITAYMRKRWGIQKVRANGDLHHAVDAVVIACVTDGMIQQISRHAKFQECQYMLTDLESIAVDPSTGEVLRRFPYPWNDFKRELEARLNPENPARELNKLHLPFYELSGEKLPEPVFVSRMPKRKVTGAAHEDTVKSAREVENGYTILKKPLTDLKLKDGEIDGYYDPQSDRLLYEALKGALIAHNGNAKEAFKEPFYKPKSDGTPGPVVKKVKILERATLTVPVHGGSGVAGNGSMVRVDVFQVNGKYRLVPIYVADTLKPSLPNKATTQHKPYSDWPEVAEEDFLFSLYPNDLIGMTLKEEKELKLVNKDSSLPQKKKGKSFLLYYRGTDSSDGRLKCITPDNTYKGRFSLDTLEKLEKYTVDVLGQYHKVGKEVRQPFQWNRR